MTDWLTSIHKALMPALPPAPLGMHWEAAVWRDAFDNDDSQSVTFHAKWRLTRTLSATDDFSHDDPCDCDSCRAVAADAAEHAAELDFAALREEGLA